MSKEMDKAQADHKKLQPQVKKFNPAQANKLKKQVKDALAAAWKAEDACTEALEAAQENGVSGKKINDYMKDKGFKDGFTNWKKAFEKHQKPAKELTQYCDDAQALFKKIAAVQLSTKDELKKPATPALNKFKTSLTNELAGLKKVVSVMGTMTAPELFYSSNFSRSVERMLKGADGGGAKSSADESKLLDPKERVKNAKKAASLFDDIKKQCDAAVEKAGDDRKQAVAEMKKTDAPLKELAQLNKLYQTAKKKSATQIKEAKDKTKIIKAIKSIQIAYTNAVSKRTQSVKAIKKAAA